MKENLNNDEIEIEWGWSCDLLWLRYTNYDILHRETNTWWKLIIVSITFQSSRKISKLILNLHAMFLTLNGISSRLSGWGRCWGKINQVKQNKTMKETSGEQQPLRFQKLFNFHLWKFFSFRHLIPPLAESNGGWLLGSIKPQIIVCKNFSPRRIVKVFAIS